MLPNFKIKHLGPIEDVEFEINHFTVLTGPQASGKSTIAKVVYFLLSIKDDFIKVLTKPKFDKGVNQSYNEMINARLVSKFTGIFGSEDLLNSKILLECKFSDDTYINISIKDSDTQGAEHKTLNFELSQNLIDLINEKDEEISMVYEGENDYFPVLSKQVEAIFNIDYDILYIPAGRGMVTALSDQLNYLLADQDVLPYSNIDYCTTKFFMEILRIRSKFINGISRLLEEKKNTLSSQKEKDRLSEFVSQINSILKGKYYYRPGNELLYLDNKDYVKMNYSSSGQQEIVWVLNIMFYYLINGNKTTLIVEEPETHLFPDTQKKVTELLSMFYNFGNDVIFTTHSPYMLGQVNNMILADDIAGIESREEIIAESQIIKKTDICALFVDDGKINEAINGNLIDNALIDGASTDINEQSDKILKMIWEEKKCQVP